MGQHEGEQRGGEQQGGRSSQRKCDRSRDDDRKFYHYGSVVTLGVGVAAVGTAGALLFFQRKKKGPTSDATGTSLRELELVPSLPLTAAAPAGAALRGRF